MKKNKRNTPGMLPPSEGGGILKEEVRPSSEGEESRRGRNVFAPKSKNVLNLNQQ